ncbi:tRNA lysidine(34) synthetase TilS [Nocardia brevicatena]|uniref:tRNA lysidine(34) synthetase TilS n=1 Tax=Nocardia brevicatena TaxID=37327 RepID=UPI000685260B|nr:tRNA lysidine(34) synthetase TilS [Nocardia brevicatena]
MRLPETAAVLALRHAVRAWLGRYLPGSAAVAVALSGGADSLALTGAALAEAEAVDALIVDHRLQEGSDEVAAAAAATALALGCRSARVLPVRVGGSGGMEAAARRARYAALDEARDGLPVLLGHTLDDQAETVLLGLAQGSGARSVQGMAPYNAPWGRPLLDIRRETTRRFCADLGLAPYEDPHNSSPEFTRVRLRTEVLPLLEDVLGGRAAVALARTAQQLREDNAVLDTFAADLLQAAGASRPWPYPSANDAAPDDPTRPPAVSSGGVGAAVTDSAAADGSLSCASLAAAPAALRRRAIRSWLLAGGAKAVTSKHIHAIDDLVVDWRGQGAVAVGGGDPGTRLVAARERGRLTLARAGRDDGDRRDTG